MNKKLVIIFLVVLTFSFVSAGWFGDLSNKIFGKGFTGKVGETTNTTQACNDSDGGLNQYVFGTTTKGSMNVTDYCASGYLYENYCSNGEIVQNYKYVCPNNYICSNGACIQNQTQTTTQTCTDSDGGRNSSVKGIAVDSYGSKSEDTCYDGVKVLESSCSTTTPKDIVVNEILACPSGYKCSNGACIQNQTSTTTQVCNDSDGKGYYEGYYTKGFVTDKNGVKIEDSCAPASSTVVLEAFCKADGNSAQYAFGCSSGYICSNGACVNKTQTSNTTTTKLPDLIVTDIRYEIANALPEPPFMGLNPVFFYAKVKNIGSEKVDRSFYIYLDTAKNSVYGEEGMGSGDSLFMYAENSTTLAKTILLLPGDEKEAILTVSYLYNKTKASTQKITAKVCADMIYTGLANSQIIGSTNNSIVESNEGNNCFTKTFVIDGTTTTTSNTTTTQTCNSGVVVNDFNGGCCYNGVSMNDYSVYSVYTADMGKVACINKTVHACVSNYGGVALGIENWDAIEFVEYDASFQNPITKDEFMCFESGWREFKDKICTEDGYGFKDEFLECKNNNFNYVECSPTMEILGDICESQLDETQDRQTVCYATKRYSTEEPPVYCPKGCKDGECIGSDGAFSSCKPEYRCETRPAKCPRSGKQRKFCEDIKCGAESYKEEVTCVPGKCSGCVLGTKCYSSGDRRSGKYCSDRLEFVNQLSDGSACKSNFECRSNACNPSLGKCVKGGFFGRIRNRMRGVFGLD